MPQVQANLMKALYGYDIWQNFQPTLTTLVPEGWNGDHPSLRRLALLGSRIAIDVGVWKGQSTICLALSMKRAGIDGCVIAVDTFLGSLEHWSAGRELFVRQHGMPNLFQTFLSNVWKAEVSDYVIPVPQTSVTAVKIFQRLTLRASVIHIDAAHEYEEVIRDAKEYWEILESGGYLVGDDYHETWPGVVQAAGEFSSRERCPLSIEPPKWILRKP